MRWFCWGFFWISSLSGLDPALFYEKFQQTTPVWMIEQFQHDLAPFQVELSKRYLDALFSAHDHPLLNKGQLFMVRIRISKGQIFVTKNKMASTHYISDEIIPHIYALHQLKPLPDIDFIISTLDSVFVTGDFPCQDPRMPALPLLTITKCKNDRGLILFPDWFSLKGYEPDLKKILVGNLQYPWETKKEVAFFRGADSGVFNLNKWEKYPRAQLVMLSLQNPTLIDAKFAPYLHHQMMIETAQKEGMLGSYVPLTMYPNYKYLVDIDGNCAATPRLPLLLHSNSVTLKNTTNSMLWFYKALKPFTHFIPVSEDLSDLLEKLKWAKEHDEECKKISDQARQLAAEILTQEAIYFYLYKLLEAYARKQNNYYE